MILTTPEIIPVYAARERKVVRYKSDRSFELSIHGWDGMLVIVADIEALKGVEMGVERVRFERKGRPRVFVYVVLRKVVRFESKRCCHPSLSLFFHSSMTCSVTIRPDLPLFAELSDPLLA
jgi:hypothetical protein